MATCPVLWLNGRVTDLANRKQSHARRLTAEFSGGRLAEAGLVQFIHEHSFAACIPSTTGRPHAATIC
jgi:precorrin-6x reductase